jgi:hypothetical protein
MSMLIAMVSAEVMRLLALSEKQAIAVADALADAAPDRCVALADRLELIARRLRAQVAPRSEPS